MQEILAKVGQQLDAVVDFLRDGFHNYPIVVSAIGGMILMGVVLKLVVMPLRIAWWRWVCWRNRLAGKFYHHNYEGEIADAVISITNRYWLRGLISSGERQNKFRVLAHALNLPQLRPDEPTYHRPLHPEAVDRLKAKKREELKALEKEPVHKKVGSDKVTPEKKKPTKLIVIDGTASKVA